MNPIVAIADSAVLGYWLWLCHGWRIGHKKRTQKSAERVFDYYLDQARRVYRDDPALFRKRYLGTWDTTLPDERP